MGLLDILLGRKPFVSGPTPRLKQASAVKPTSPRTDTCWWAEEGTVALAAGRGFTFNIVGESRYQKQLDRLCGGRCEEGHKKEVGARLTFENNPHDRNAIAVSIQGKQVGWVPSELAAEMRAQISEVSPKGVVTCKAKIVGGWDKDDYQGSYGVKLSIPKPIKTYQPS